MPMLDVSVQGLTSIFNPTVGIYMCVGVPRGLLVGIISAVGDVTGAITVTLTLPLMHALMLALGPRSTS